MGAIQESLPVAAFYNNPQQIILGATGAITLAATATKAIEIVHQGEMGVRMKRGRPMERRGYSEEELAEIGRYVTHGPGIYGVFPLLRKIVKVNVQDRTERYQGFDIESADGQLFTVDPIFTWHVRADGDNPYKALFNVKNEKDNNDVAKDFELQQTVVGICVGGLHRALRGKTARDLKDINSQEIDAKTKEECYEDLLEYGTALKRVVLPPITRKDSEVLKQGLERSGVPSLGAVALGPIEADEHGMGAVLPFPRPGDAA